MSYDLNKLSDCNLAINIVKENIRLFKQHIDPWLEEYKDVEMPEKIKKFINKYNNKIRVEQEQLYYFQDCKIKLIENNKIKEKQYNLMDDEQICCFQGCKKLIENNNIYEYDQSNKRQRIEQCSII